MKCHECRLLLSRLDIYDLYVWFVWDHLEGVLASLREVTHVQDLLLRAETAQAAA